MGQKKKIHLMAVAVIGILLVAFTLLWPNQTNLRLFIDNYKMGTFNPNLSDEDLVRKRTLGLEGISFIVPRSWSVMKDFPQKGMINFELNLTKSDGSIELAIYSSNQDTYYTNIDQPLVSLQVNDWLSNISTLANKRVEANADSKSINSMTWKVIQATDSTAFGNRHSGIYYAVKDGKLIRLYFFSIDDSAKPIMDAVEELIQGFQINK